MIVRRPWPTRGCCAMGKKYIREYFTSGSAKITITLEKLSLRKDLKSLTHFLFEIRSVIWQIQLHDKVTWSTPWSTPILDANTETLLRSMNSDALGLSAMNRQSKEIEKKRKHSCCVLDCQTERAYRCTVLFIHKT